MKRKTSPSPSSSPNKNQRIHHVYNTASRDVVSHVALFVQPNELFDTVPLVCSTWNEALEQSSYIWKELYQNTFHIDYGTKTLYGKDCTWKHAFKQRYTWYQQLQEAFVHMKNRVTVHETILTPKQLDLDVNPVYRILKSASAFE